MDSCFRVPTLSFLLLNELLWAPSVHGRSFFCTDATVFAAALPVLRSVGAWIGDSLYPRCVNGVSGSTEVVPAGEVCRIENVLIRIG